jgi:hypothetical protein
MYHEYVADHLQIQAQPDDPNRTAKPNPVDQWQDAGCYQIGGQIGGQSGGQIGGQIGCGGSSVQYLFSCPYLFHINVHLTWRWMKKRHNYLQRKIKYFATDIPIG